MSKNNRKTFANMAGKSSRTTLAPGFHQARQEQQAAEDQRLIHDLAQLDEKVTPQQLANPEGAKFLISRTIPKLIENIALVLCSEFQTKMADLVREKSEYSEIHQKFINSTGLAAITQFFIGLFNGKQGAFTIEDLMHPEGKRIRFVLRALMDIMHVTSSYDEILIEIYNELKMDKDKLSDLWDQDVKLTAVIQQHEQEVVDNAQQIEKENALSEKLEMELTTLQTWLKELMEKKEADERKLQELTKNSETSKLRLEALDKEEAELKSQLIPDGLEIKSQIKKQQEEVEALRLERDKLIQDQQTQKKRNIELEDAGRRLDIIATNFFTTAPAACQRLRAAQKSRQKSEAENMMFDSAIKEGRAEVENLKRRVAVLREKVDRKKSDDQRQVEEAAKLRKQLKSDIAGLNKSLEASKTVQKNFRDSIDDEDDKITEIQNKTQQLETEDKTLMEQRNDRLKDIRQTTRSKLDDYSIKLDQASISLPAHEEFKTSLSNVNEDVKRLLAQKLSTGKRKRRCGARKEIKEHPEIQPNME